MYARSSGLIHNFYRISGLIHNFYRKPLVVVGSPGKDIDACAKGARLRSCRGEVAPAEHMTDRVRCMMEHVEFRLSVASSI